MVLAPLPGPQDAKMPPVGPWYRRELIEYLEVPLRRPWHVAIPFAVVTLLFVVLAYALPKRYEAWSLILLEAEKAPDTIAGGDERGGRRARLFGIRDELATRMRLEKILNEFDPYADLRHKLTRGMMVDKLRHDLDVVVKGSDAFALGFVHRNPEVAANVVNRLSTLFVDESNQAREAQMEGAAEFIDAQLEDARRQLEAKELDLRRYKEAHVGKLPEHSQANMGTLQRLQLESESLAESLRTARERQLLLERAAMTPGAPLPQAPAAAAETSAELGQLRAQLAALRSRYTDEHPDVQALTDRIALLQKRQDVTSPATSAGPGAASESTPSLARLQLEQVRLEIADLEAKRSEMDRRMAFFQRRIDDTPQTEQELATLTRDYQKLSENYLGFLKKKFDTQVAERLERRWRTAHFRVLDPAYPPEKPSFPKPWLFILLGAVLGLGSGVGVSLLAELLDHSIKGLRELEAVLPYPVLAAFPHVTPFKRPRS